MKYPILHFILTAVVSSSLLVACSPTDKPRQEHEPKKVWQPKHTPEDQEIDNTEFSAFDLTKAYGILAASQEQAKLDLLIPLERVVLNAKFVELPRYRTPRLSQMIQVFNWAFLTALRAETKPVNFEGLKQKYIETVFSGCSRDLSTDCINARLFAYDSRHTQIMTALATDFDTKIEAEISKTGSDTKCITNSEQCRSLVEERYRLLAMGNLKRNLHFDTDYSFAYLKYARIFSSLIDYTRANPSQTDDGLTTGYLAEAHSTIFETLITQYEPKDKNDPEFRAFVESFNPWLYSAKSADSFHPGAKKMFEFGADCCLYDDAKKAKINKAISDAIIALQDSEDSFGPSFQQMIREIKSASPQIFANMGMADSLAQVSDIHSSFYNEYFLVVDRLFRGHFTTKEVEMVLAKTPSERTAHQLPKTILTYIKVYLLHAVLKTNLFMNEIYNSPSVASDRVFQDAVTSSRELTDRWHSIQGQIDLLDSMMGSYFRGNGLTSLEFYSTRNVIRSVNRNIHYISVYPNMLMMVYFLSKMNGKIVFNTWWGPIDVDSNEVLDNFFDGNVASRWFAFGKDPEPLDRQMLLYAWEYLLSTDALNFFSTKDGDRTRSERTKFFDVIFSKYLDSDLEDLRTKLSENEERSEGSPVYSQAQTICDYELDKSRLNPGMTMSLLDLANYTYSGNGAFSINGFLSEALAGNNYMIASAGNGNAKNLAALFRSRTESRITYVKALIDLIEFDLLRRKEIRRKGEVHPETAKAYSILRTYEGFKVSFANSYIAKHKRYLDCALRLQEIERRRANRIYGEERKRLGQIFDKMKPLVATEDPAARTNIATSINDELKAEGARFDQVFSLTYRFSKFDLLKRVTKYVQNDIFKTPSEEESKIYGEDGSRYYRSRPVLVTDPSGLEREDFVAKGTSISITITGATESDRKAFIDQGMAALNGKKDSFVLWNEQRSNDKSLVTYLNNLQDVYLLGPIHTSNGTLEVTAKDLAEAFVKVLASYHLDSMDQENAVQFGNEGRFDKEFWVNKLFEANGSRRPFFYMLMADLKGRAGIDLDSATSANSGREAMAFAETLNNTLNNRRPFVFEPSKQVAISVKDLYGKRTHFVFHRVKELYDYLQNLEKETPNLATLDPRLANPVSIISQSPVYWLTDKSKLVDAQKVHDNDVLIDDFIRRTGNFYDSRQELRAQ